MVRRAVVLLHWRPLWYRDLCGYWCRRARLEDNLLWSDDRYRCMTWHDQDLRRVLLQLRQPLLLCRRPQPCFPFTYSVLQYTSDAPRLGTRKAHLVLVHREPADTPDFVPELYEAHTAARVEGE